MTSEIVRSTIERMDKSVAHTRDEMMHIRTGKATPALLDGLKVDYYGTPTLIKQIASIAAPDARLLVVHPFDKNALDGIEKAVLSSDLGFNPQNDGNVIRVPIPILTAERREELIKLVRRFAEEGRIAIRGIRHDVNDRLRKEEKAGEISEDESHRLLDQVQKETDKHIAEIDALLKTRETDIREE